MAVVAPVGVLDDEALVRLGVEVCRAPAPAVVLDLTGCVLVNRAALAAIDVARWGRSVGDVCIVCRRLSGRLVLAHAGVGLPVFGTVQDATQALLLGDEGYGTGWR